jgi:septum formation protein
MSNLVGVPLSCCAMPTLILASGSPRRRDLLAGMGIDFSVRIAPVVELDAASGLGAPELALANARRKARAVAGVSPGAWVLGADTVVALPGRIFGKPSNLDEARDFLRRLGGREHEVFTGCVLLDPAGEEETLIEKSGVTFLPLDEAAIERYLGCVHVLDKAGGYAVQDHPEMLIAGVEGSRSNVIGLPVEKLAGLFRRHGLL